MWVDCKAVPKERPPATKKRVSQGKVLISDEVSTRVKVKITSGTAATAATVIPCTDPVNQRKTVSTITPITIFCCIGSTWSVPSLSIKSSKMGSDSFTYFLIKTQQLITVNTTATGKP